MASNVLAQAIQLISSVNSANSASMDSGVSKLQAQLGAGFGQMFSNSLKNQMGNSGNMAEAIKQNPSPGKQFAANPVESKKDAIPTAEASTPVENAEPQKLPSETAEAVEDGIKKVVKDELGLTDEELEEAMSVLGLGYLDLLMPENMKALVLEVNQADTMDFLTNESLNSQLANLLEGVEGVLSEAGLEQPSPEELPKLLESLKEAKAELLPEQQAAVATAETKAEPKVEIIKENTDAEAAEPNVKRENVSVAKAEESAGKEETKNDSTGSKRQDGHNDIFREQNQNPLDAIIQNLSKQMSPDEVTATAAQRLEAMQEIVNQVIEQIRINIRPDTTSMELMLNPENLGKVSLKVIAKDGHLMASFTAQNQVTKEALESQMQTLKDNLNSQGIKVEAIEVNIESFAFDERNQMGGGQENSGQSKPKERKLSSDDIARAFGEDADGEEVSADTAAITQTGGSVDYTV